MPGEPSPTDLAATLFQTASGPASGDTLDRLLPLVYDQLREVARRHLARERPGHTLQTTALVHEAYFKLVGDGDVTRRGRGYFFAAASRAMRQVLVEHARRRAARKRDGAAAPAEERVHAPGDALAVEILDLDRALDRLARLNPRHARVIECRFFGGLSVDETAEALDISPRTVKYDWALARAWLYEALTGTQQPEAGA